MLITPSVYMLTTISFLSHQAVDGPAIGLNAVVVLPKAEPKIETVLPQITNQELRYVNDEMRKIRNDALQVARAPVDFDEPMTKIEKVDLNVSEITLIAFVGIMSHSKELMISRALSDIVTKRVNKLVRNISAHLSIVPLGLCMTPCL